MEKKLICKKCGGYTMADENLAKLYLEDGMKCNCGGEVVEDRSNEMYYELKKQKLINEIRKIDSGVEIREIECSDLKDSEASYFYSVELFCTDYLSDIFLDRLSKIENVMILYITTRDNELVLKLHFSFSKKGDSQ